MDFIKNVELIKKIESDYYTNTKSYIKTIIDLLPNGVITEEEKDAVKMLYNYFMHKADEKKRNEIKYISAAFCNKLNEMSDAEILLMVNYFYSYFIRNMIYDFVNRDKLFDVMNESIKVIVGFYSAYQSICFDNSGEVNITVGSYR